MNPALRSIAATGLLLAAGVPDAALAPREAVSLVFAPAEGTVLRRVHENRASYEVVEIGMTLDGEPPPIELPEPDVSIEALERIVVVDTLGAVEDGRPERLEREFAELTWETEYSSAEQEQTTEDVCDLEGTTVAFDWDADDERYDVSVDEDADVDGEDLELLTEDMDLRSFLPDGEVEVGDGWQLEVEAYLALIWPGGVLKTHAEGEEVDEVQLELSLALIEDVDFEGTATLEEVEEADERRVAVIAFELDVTSDAEVEVELEEGEVTLRRELERSIEGTLRWDLSAGHAVGLSAEADGEMRAITMQTIEDPEGVSHDLEQVEVLEGSVTYSIEIEAQ